MKRIILLAALVAFFSSCTKVMDGDPTDFVSPVTYFNTEQQLSAAVTGVYDCLQKGNMYAGGDGLGTVFNVTDEMYYAQSGTGPKVWNFTTNEPLVLNIWSSCYTGIQRANVVLSYINKPVMDEAKRKIYKGEAQFLRAYFYFILVQNFGGVPLRKEPTPSVTDVNLPRSSANEVYDFIISEMTEAEGLVAPMTAYAYNERITQSAVQGILARVCLFKAGFPNNDVSKYAEALKWANKVIESGLHDLNPSYSQPFINLIQNLYDTKENLWEIGFYTTGTDDSYTEYAPGLAITLGVTQSNGSFPVVAGQYRIHQRLYNLYEKDPYLKDALIPDKSFDLRRDWNLAPFKYGAVVNNALTKTYYTAAQIYDRQPNKFDRAYELTAKRYTSNGPFNYVMLRYSDVLLMAAEAENEVQKGPTAYARGLVDTVRRRGYGKKLNGEGVKFITLIAGGSGYTTAPTVTITGGGGSGATATATISTTTKTITSIDITNHGTFYSAPPTITITGGGGTGVSATATLTQRSDADMKPAQYAGKDEFLKTIQDERARELCFEGWRRLDLMRWGILVSTLRAVADESDANAPAAYKPYASIGGRNISDVNNYLPIPANEISLNKLVSQNPGW
jgi:hypothetical protein